MTVHTVYSDLVRQISLYQPFTQVLYLCKHTIDMHSILLQNVLCVYSVYFSQIRNVAQSQGCGMCLVDFGQAVDLHAFRSDVMFVGSYKTDELQCSQMIEGTPWKWQVLPSHTHTHTKCNVHINWLCL